MQARPEGKSTPFLSIRQAMLHAEQRQARTDAMNQEQGK